MTLGERIESERKRMKLTQEEVAAACGVVRRTQGLYEANHRHPDALYLQRADLLGFDIYFIVTGKPARPGAKGTDSLSEAKTLIRAALRVMEGGV